MRIIDLIGKLFGIGVPSPADAMKLDGTTEAALARSLSALPPDERGWITFGEARMLFSTKGDQYAFGETDEGRKNIESFAAQHQSVINFMPVERRVYFVRSHGGMATIRNRELTSTEGSDGRTGGYRLGP
jgi:hypothetical protein